MSRYQVVNSYGVVEGDQTVGGNRHSIPSKYFLWFQEILVGGALRDATKNGCIGDKGNLETMLI